MTARVPRGHCKAALPPGRDARDAAKGDEGQRHDAAVSPAAAGAVLGDGLMDEIGGLEVIPDIQGDIIVDASSENFPVFKRWENADCDNPIRFPSSVLLISAAEHAMFTFCWIVKIFTASLLFIRFSLYLII